MRARALCAGHFPDQPLVPGAALLALMAELGREVAPAGHRLAAVERALFRRRVSPGAEIVVAATRERRRVHATVRHRGRIAARATLCFGSPP